jgi:Sulfotransferase domain
MQETAFDSFCTFCGSGNVGDYHALRVLSVPREYVLGQGTGVQWYDGIVAFFSTPKKYKTGLEGYQKMFAKCDYKTAVVDASPGIMLHPKKVSDIYEKQGKESKDLLRVIIVLREPVTSHVLWYKNRGLDPMLGEEGGVAKVIRKQRETAGYKGSAVAADYVYWLKLWCRLFDRQQIFLVSHEELVRDPDKVAERIGNFLERDFYGKFQSFNQALNETRALLPCDDKIQSELAAAFKAPNDELYEFLREHPGSEYEQSPFPKFQFACE